MLEQLKRPQLKAPEPRRPAPLPLKPATAPAMPMPSVFTRPLEQPPQKKQRKACPACEEEGTTCPACQKKAAATLERPPPTTQMGRGSPGEEPAERQADELGKQIGEELKGTESVGHGPLPKSVQDVAETHLGVSLEGTHVDAGSGGQRKAKDESALAVTEGKRIAFGEGQLDTSSEDGRALLGHELVHVAQQGNGGTRQRQRVLDKDDQKLWDKRKGDKAVADVNSLAARWESFAKLPAKYAAMPPRKPHAFKELNELTAGEPTLAKEARSRVGAKRLAQLQEYVSMVPVKPWPNGLGLTSLNPAHRYVLTTVSSKVPRVSKVQVTYTNNYRWKWTATYTGVFVEFTPKPEISELDLLGAAYARPPSFGYWGPEDIIGFAATVGPQATLPGKRIQTGAEIKATGTGPGGSLDFEDYVVHYCPGAPGAAPGGSLVQLGHLFVGAHTVSYLTGGMVVQSRRILHRSRETEIFGFALNSSVIPSTNPLTGDQPLSKLIDFATYIKGDLDTSKGTALVVHDPWVPDVKIDVEGFASRMWRGARTSAERRAKNIALSKARADSARKPLESVLDGMATIRTHGAGGATRLSSTGRNEAPLASEETRTGRAAIAEAIRKDIEDLMKRFGYSRAEATRIAERRYGPSSDAPDARGIRVSAHWTYLEVSFGRPAVTEPIVGVCGGTTQKEIPAKPPTYGAEPGPPGLKAKPEA